MSLSIAPSSRAVSQSPDENDPSTPQNQALAAEGLNQTEIGDYHQLVDSFEGGDPKTITKAVGQFENALNTEHDHMEPALKASMLSDLDEINGDPTNIELQNDFEDRYGKSHDNTPSDGTSSDSGTASQPDDQQGVNPVPGDPQPKEPNQT